MLIFILEDNPKRMVKFHRATIGHLVHHADNVEDAARLVALYKYDILFLDHDLGGEQFVDSSEDNTGYQLAKFITSSTQNRYTPCVIHSCNPDGAKNMAHAIPHAVRMPFVSMDIKSVVDNMAFSKARDKRCQ